MKVKRFRRHRRKGELHFQKRTFGLNMEAVAQVLFWLFKIAIVCGIAFVCVWYFGRRISNVGDSMSPTVENGEVVLVNRIVYDASAPRRGDVIVFQPNGNENTQYAIKRIVGLPGETIQIKEQKVYIDGEKLNEKYGSSKITDPGIAAEELTLDNDEYFVLGDNVDSSEDSRMANFGNVRRAEIFGKAWFVVTPGKHFGFIK